MQHFFHDVFIAWYPVHRKDVEPAEHEHTHGGPYRLTPVESQTHHHAACYEDTERLTALLFTHVPWPLRLIHRSGCKKCCIVLFGLQSFHAQPRSDAQGFIVSCFASLSVRPSLPLPLPLPPPPSPAFGPAVSFEQPKKSPAPHVAFSPSHHEVFQPRVLQIFTVEFRLQSVAPSLNEEGCKKKKSLSVSAGETKDSSFSLDASTQLSAPPEWLYCRLMVDPHPPSFQPIVLLMEIWCCGKDAATPLL